jgi:hypothetical protein
MEPDIKNSIIKEMRDKLKRIDPQTLSKNTGAAFQAAEENRGEFQLTFFGEDITITYPDFIIRNPVSNEQIQEHVQGLILYYFVTANGAPPGGKWVALSELPDGGFYNQAYQGYSGNRLIKIFGNDTDAFRNSALASGGTPESYGDLGFSFQAFPNVRLLAVYWKGDEEFSPSAKVLFDSLVCHYLPTDLCAFLGSILTNKLIEAK